MQLLYLAQQHRRDLLVAHALNLALGIAVHDFRQHLSDFLGDQAELHRLLALLVGLDVTELHRTQAIETLADIAERLDVLLVASRGGRHAQLARRRHDDVSARLNVTTDPGDERRALGRYPGR